MAGYIDHEGEYTAKSKHEDNRDKEALLKQHLELRRTQKYMTVAEKKAEAKAWGDKRDAELKAKLDAKYKANSWAQSNERILAEATAEAEAAAGKGKKKAAGKEKEGNPLETKAEIKARKKAEKLAKKKANKERMAAKAENKDEDKQPKSVKTPDA